MVLVRYVEMPGPWGREERIHGNCAARLSLGFSEVNVTHDMNRRLVCYCRPEFYTRSSVSSSTLDLMGSIVRDRNVLNIWLDKDMTMNSRLSKAYRRITRPFRTQTRVAHCLRCDYTWKARGKLRPKKCPLCESTRWDRPMVRWAWAHDSWAFPITI